MRRMLWLPLMFLMASCYAPPPPATGQKPSLTTEKNVSGKTKMSKQSLVFAKEFMPQVRSGKKQVTIRRGKRPYRPGQRVIGRCSGDEGVLIEITECKQMPLKEVPQQDLMDDGFQGAEQALQSLRRWYSDLTLDSTVSVIRFRLCEDK